MIENVMGTEIVDPVARLGPTCISSRCLRLIKTSYDFEQLLFRPLDEPRFEPPILPLR
jgi:hypothetical protein